MAILNLIELPEVTGTETELMFSDIAEVFRSVAVSVEVREPALPGP